MNHYLDFLIKSMDTFVPLMTVYVEHQLQPITFVIKLPIKNSYHWPNERINIETVLTFFLFCRCFTRPMVLGEPAVFDTPFSFFLSAAALVLLFITLFFTTLFESTLLDGSSESLSESLSDLEQGLSELELKLELLAKFCCLLLDFSSVYVFPVFSMGLLQDLRTAAMVSLRLFACVLVTENSGDGLLEDDSWLELELSESEESDWLQEPEALPEFWKKNRRNLFEWRQNQTNFCYPKR